MIWILAAIAVGGIFLAVGVGMAKLEGWVEDVTGWRMFPDSQEFEDEQEITEGREVR